MNDPGGPYPYHQGIPIDIFPAYIQTRRQFKAREFMGMLPPFSNRPHHLSGRYSAKHNLYNFGVGTLQRLFRALMLARPLRDCFLRWSDNGERGFTYDPDRPWFQFFPVDCVLPLGSIKFEDYEFPCPRDADRYLTIYYGDWRTPPPESKRGGHETEAIYPDTPCPFERSLREKRA